MENRFFRPGLMIGFLGQRAPWAEQIVEGRRKFMTTKRRNADLAPWAELIANDEDLAPWAEQIVKGTKKSETKLGCSYT